jgi:3-dehydroquinate synthase
MNPARIPVGGESAYGGVVGTAVLGELKGLLGEETRRAAIIHAEGLGEVARPVRSHLQDAGCEVTMLGVPDGEGAKDITVAAALWNRLGEAGFTRSDLVVGVGGGAVTDLAGFVAATWLRGVRVVHVPTTLLAMVDAAIGGKTGINTAAGKNLVGAFHAPAGVLCDLATLPSLPQQDYISGLAEVIKAGFIADPQILDLVESDPDGAARPDGPHTRELITRAIAVKAEVTSGDLREKGRREILNYGHTLGHAIERAEDYAFRHGHAVAVGMVFAAELARRSGHIDAALADRHRRVLTSVGLPTGYAPGAWPRLREVMNVDKKARGATLRFVILDGLARPTTLVGPDEELLRAAYADVSA